MFVRNAWYAAAMSHECTSKPLARTILGEQVVLFRTTDERCVALQDRCRWATSKTVAYGADTTG